MLKLKTCKRKEKKQPQSFVIEGVKNLTKDHDVQKTWKQKLMEPNETKKKGAKKDIPKCIQEGESSNVQEIKKQTHAIEVENQEDVSKEDTEQRKKNLTEGEQELVEVKACMNTKKTREKLDAAVGKARSIVITECTRILREYTQIDKDDASKRESQDIDSTRSSPHKTAHGEEIKGSTEMSQKQSKSDKEKITAEPKNKGNKIQNWETSNKEWSTLNQSERDARNYLGGMSRNSTRKRRET